MTVCKCTLACTYLFLVRIKNCYRIDHSNRQICFITRSVLSPSCADIYLPIVFLGYSEGRSCYGPSVDTKRMIVVYASKQYSVISWRDQVTFR